ncbi:MAG: putative oxidoreductase [Chloroflexi bacterium]|jgi:monoamine oxidase|nr:putative oxidoreductase [Chloroflexota bacterium]
MPAMRVNAWVAGVFGCPIERIPALGLFAWIADYDYSVISVFLGESEVLRDGTSSAIEAMARDSGARIRLNTPVRRVTQTERGVTVTTHAGENFSARAAVVAVPLNTLGDISFDPLSNGGAAGSGTRRAYRALRQSLGPGRRRATRFLWRRAGPGTALAGNPASSCSKAA